MSVTGIMKGGVVVLDDPQSIPDGTRVQVVLMPPRDPESASGQPTLEGLLKFAGVLKDLPPDMAEQHDHYIHGTPRR